MIDKIKAELVPFGHPTEVCLSFVESGQPVCFSHTHYEDYKENLNRLATCWNYHEDLVGLAENIARGVGVDIESVQALLQELEK